MSLAVTAVLLSGSTVRAQDFSAAAAHFGAAQQAFGKQHFHTAAAEFQMAYDITKDPVLLYNIGEAWQKAGDGKKAVASYKAYLKAQPNAQDRADVQKRIKTIEAAKFNIPDQSAPGDSGVAPTAGSAPKSDSDVPGTAPPPPPASGPPAPAPSPAELVPPTPPPPGANQNPGPAPPPSPVPDDQRKSGPAGGSGPEKPPGPSGGLLEDQPVSKMRVAAWIGVAATVATLTAGAIFGLSAQARADDISRRFSFVDTNGQPHAFDAAAQKDYQSLKDDGELYNDLAISFFSISGALAVTTTVLFIVDAKRPATKQAFHIVPSLSPNHAGLAAGWSF
jgi:hypothetical protein